MPKGDFTPNQVAALLEDLRSEFRIVGEVVRPLPERLGRVESRLTSLEREVRGLKDAFELTIPGVLKRLSSLESSRA